MYDFEWPYSWQLVHWIMSLHLYGYFIFIFVCRIWVMLKIFLFNSSSSKSTKTSERFIFEVLCVTFMTLRTLNLILFIALINLAVLVVVTSVVSLQCENIFLLGANRCGIQLCRLLISVLLFVRSMDYLITFLLYYWWWILIYLYI